MKRFIISTIAAILFVFSYCQGVNAQSTTEDTVTIPRSTFLKAKQAADELVVARTLIATQDQLITEIRENKKLLTEKNTLLESIVKIRTDQLTESNTIITSLKEENQILIAQNSKLKRSNKLLKRVAKVAGAVVVALVAPKFF